MPPKTKPTKSTEKITPKDIGSMPEIFDPIKTPAIDPDPTPKPAPQSYLSPITKDNVKGVLASINLPEYLQSLEEVPDTSPKAEYLGFASTRSKAWPNMQAAGCLEGMPFAFTQGQYIAFPTGMNGHLIDVKKFFTTMEGQEGKITRCTLEDTGVNGHEVHYLAFWIVRLPGNRYIPIRGDFRRTKAGGFEQAMTSLKLAATPEWLSLSDSHKVSAVFPYPWGRVIHTLTTSREVSKTSMNVYYRTQCFSKPSSMDDIQMLANVLRDEEFRARMNEQWIQYGRRNEFYHSLIGK